MKSSLFFILIYIAGILSIIFWQKRKEYPRYSAFITTWSLLWIASHLILLECLKGHIFFLIPLAFFLVFYWSYHHEKTNLRNGFLFNLFLIVFSSYSVYISIITQDLIVFGVLIFLGSIALAVLLFGLIGLTILLYWNGAIMVKREAHSLANLLTLLLAIALTFLLIYNHFIAQMLPEWLGLALSVLPFSLMYFSISFLNYLTLSILYQWNQPKWNQDYIIVLGAGLIDGQFVTPLLAKRIDQAIDFYRQQLTRTGVAPFLVMSGGKGSDEKISEAQAMANDAIAKGIPENKILLEEQSTTTFENMLFSKNLIFSRQEQANVIFSSNNYHILRAGIFAKQAQLQADGIGAKTALYYLPTAFLREFIAIIAIHKKKHFIRIALASLLILSLALVSFLMRNYV